MHVPRHGWLAQLLITFVLPLAVLIFCSLLVFSAVKRPLSDLGHQLEATGDPARKAG